MITDFGLSETGSSGASPEHRRVEDLFHRCSAPGRRYLMEMDGLSEPSCIPKSAPEI